MNAKVRIKNRKIFFIVDDFGIWGKGIKKTAPKRSGFLLRKTKIKSLSLWQNANVRDDLQRSQGIFVY